MQCRLHVLTYSLPMLRPSASSIGPRSTRITQNRSLRDHTIQGCVIAARRALVPMRCGSAISRTPIWAMPRAAMCLGPSWRQEEVEDMGVTLRDKKPASAPSSGQHVQEPQLRRGRVSWLIICVSALVALLAGVGVLVFLRQPPAATTQKQSAPPPSVSAGPISAVAGGHLLLAGASGWANVTPAHFDTSGVVDGQFLTPKLGWAVDVLLSGKTTTDFVVFSTTDGGATWTSVTVPWQDEGEATG